MKFFKSTLFIFLALLSFSVVAADKLAIAEPVGSGGVSKEDLNLFWSTLEANVSSKDFDLVSRAALQSMLTEIGLVESSALVNLNSDQKAKLGELKTVNYILVSNLGRVGSKYVATMMILDVSTGEIMANKRSSVMVDSVDELNFKIKSYLRDINLGPAVPTYGRSALLTPVLLVPNPPSYLVTDLNLNLEKCLIKNGVKMQNLKSVTAILQKNNIGNLAEAEPATYARIGDLLQVDYLIQMTVDRFSMREVKKDIPVTQQKGVIRHLGDVSGSVRIISAQTGETVAVTTFKEKVDFDLLDDDTTDWEEEDFGRRMIEIVLPQVCNGVLAEIRK